MAENIIKPTGATKASKNDAGGAALRSEPVIATVKNNVDPVRQGRIQVFVDDVNGVDPDDSSGWVTVRYMSPFYGRTYGSSPDNGTGQYGTNPVSYGEWHSPPDVGTKVICVFVNGDPNYGFYIGCIPEPEALTMVPAIGAVDSKVTMNDGEAKGLAGATQLPVTNLNSDNTGEAESDNYLNATKPVHSYVASILSQQGLIRDNIRGPITTGAQRETPSRVGWGVSTPGRPIYEGGFTDANVVDAATSDKASATKIVSRRAGHTFVMDDGDILGKDQLIRLRTALGHQILMSDDGQCLFIIHANGQSWIELGAEGTIDMFSTNSVNIRTQGDLNLHADNNININTEKNLNIRAKENIVINSEKETDIRVGTDFKQQTINNHTVKVGAGMSMESAEDASYASGATTYINGSVVNLNTGQTSLTPNDVTALPLIAQTDTLFDNDKGFAPAPAKLQTIVSRAPAHMPWPMAGKGVDVKVDLNADSALPDSPSSAVSDTNDTVPSIPDNPPSVATGATVPNLGSAGGVLDSSSTSALVSSVASQASAVASQAVSAGSAILNNVPAIGQLAQTPTQMVTGGALKIGSDTLINGLVAQGASVTGAMTDNMFTGQQGVQSVQSFVNSTTAQVSSVVNNLSQSQSQLTSAGVLTGNESPTAVAGTILAGAQNGVAQTASFVQNSASVSGPLAAAASQLSSSASGIAQSISSGNFASNLSATGASGLTGLAGALGGSLNSATGVIASAFNSVVSAYKSFTAGIPQDLKAIASGTANQTPASNPINNAVTNAAGAASSLLSATTGLQGIPGGLGTLASTVNNAVGAVNSIPGASAITGAINNQSTSLMNGISFATASASSALGSVTGALSGATGGLPSLSSIPGAGSLTSALTSLLPSNLAGPLGTALGALTSNGPSPIKMPVVADNTIDRSGFTKQLGSILGNPKIPAPNYGASLAVTSYYEQETKKLEAQQQARQALYDKIDAQKDIVLKIRDDYQAAIDNYPPGDPAIVTQRELYYSEKAKWVELVNQLASA
jgi:hypothetical protein